MKLSSICVFCGSNSGVDPVYMERAAGFGQTAARRGLRLVYGGGHVGLMGALADAALVEGGEVRGVITRALEAREIAHQGLTSLQVVETMHERKARMADMADAFVMLPGGFGTWDEFCEAVTWTQLGVHSKPCGVLEVAGYFDPLRALVEGATREGFIRPEHAGLVVMDSDPAALLDRLALWEPVRLDRWLDRRQR